MNIQLLHYYDAHAEVFVIATENMDMRSGGGGFYAVFMPGQKILNAGCGCGRDVITFREAGYKVEW